MYNVDLANEDCIFDSADDFETLAEVKEWVEKHSGRFRVMIDDEKGTFMENHNPLANFVHQKNGSYRYYNGWDWVYFKPFE